MTQDPRHRRLKALFLRASERAPEERGAFLDGACDGDEELRREVEALIGAHERAGEFLSTPAPGAAEGLLLAAEQAGRRVGRYKLLQKIGEGGFGTVWMAEQEQPVRRRVALKVIKLGMDTAQVVARFEAERQALAMMDHPGIARVFDAGTTDEGRPYFVMELVNGVPITRFCEERGLTLTERLELFRDVCHAVQHAHQKGVIHRDLKPPNVLVTLQDGRPLPKVIDFGIAKAVDQRLTERTLFTEFQQIIGTPEYMSPEQAELTSLDVDTRSDIYSLGVLLYELVTGTKPFEMKTLLEEQGYFELLRHIREVEPEKPSTRLSRLSAASAQEATARPVGRVRSDLDWVVMKALEKDRGRRYATASAFAEDIGRFLADEPVQAVPPGTGYRLRKYFKRHRLAVLSAGGVALALLAGTALAVAGYLEARDQRGLAVEREQEARREREAALDAARRAETVTRVLQQMLSSADPRELKGPDYTLRRLLDDFDRDLPADLAAEPLIEATVRGTMGRAYLGLGLPRRAEPHLLRALELRERELSPGDPLVAESLEDVARLQFHLGRAADAVARMDRAIEAHAAAGSGERWLLKLRGERAYYLARCGRVAEAEEAGRAALAEMRRSLAPEDSVRVQAEGSLGLLLAEVGRLDEALELLRGNVDALVGTLPDDHPDVLTARNNHALALADAGRLEDAEAELRDLLERRVRLAGPEHVQVAMAANNLGEVLYRQERYAEALAQFERAHERLVSSLGAGHPESASCLGNVAAARRKAGDPDGATAQLEQALEHLAGREDWVARRSTLLNNYALSLGEVGRTEEALEVLRDARALLAETFGNGHPEYATTWFNEAALRRARGELDTSAELYRRVVDLRARHYPGDHVVVLRARVELGIALALAGRREEAEREHLAVLERVDPDVTEARRIEFFALTSLGRLQLDEGRGAEALRRFERSLAVRRTVPGGNVVVGVDDVARAWMQLGEQARAREVLEEALADEFAADDPVHAAERAKLLQRLGESFLMDGAPARAVPVLEECLRLRPDAGDLKAAEAGALHGLALYRLGRLEDSLSVTRDALRRFRALLPPADPELGRYMSNVAAVLEDLGRVEEALAVRREAVAECRARGWGAAVLAGHLANLGLRELEHDPARAVRTLEECVELRGRILPEDHWLLHNARSMWAAAVLRASDAPAFAELEEVLVDAYRRMRPPEDSLVRKREAFERVAELYRRMGEPGRAEQWEARDWRGAER